MEIPSRATYRSMTSAELVRRAAKGEPDSRIFGVSLSNIRYLDTVRSLAQQLQHPVNIVDIYVGWGSGFPTQSVEAISATGAMPEITWEPWHYQLGVHQDTYSLTSIAGGGFDSYVLRWAQAAAAWKRPFLLRFAHEMNGNWYPWSVGVNGNTAQDYVDAYQHVHDLFDTLGASNVLWIWSPNVLLPSNGSLAAMYPGAQYVNFIGIDGYNFGTGVPGSKWQSPAQVFGPTIANIASFAPNSPILITETAASEEGGSKADWITEFAAYLATQPSIAGFIWTEYVAKADWPIESSVASEAAMRAVLANYWTGPAH